MLKILPPCSLIPPNPTKCGEIFCDTFENFTIFCGFCQMKLFAYEDFLQHIQNVHFDAITKECNDDFNRKEELMDENSDELLVVLERKETLMDEKSDELLEAMERKEELMDENSDEFLEALESFDILYDIEDNNEEDDSSKEETMNIINVKSRFNRKSNKKSNIVEEQINSEEPLQLSPIYEIDDLVSAKEKFPTLTCPDCQEIFSLKKAYDQHVVEQHIGHKCPKCEWRFRHRHHLKRHYQNIHAEGKTRNRLQQRINCPYPECPKSFSLQESLKYHLEFHTMECTFVCNFENCTEAYPTQQRLEQHQKKHTMPRTFVCSFENCGKAFPNNQRLKVHQEVHDPAKRYICDACGYSCRTTTALKIHKRTHTGERPFTCKICENAFTSQATLHLHMNTHVTMRPHVCPICQATFANRQILKRHAFIHSDEKLFKCQICDKAFKQPQCLDGHMRRMHRETKPKKVKCLKSLVNSSETTI